MIGPFVDEILLLRDCREDVAEISQTDVEDACPIAGRDVWRTGVITPWITQTDHAVADVNDFVCMIRDNFNWCGGAGVRRDYGPSDARNGEMFPCRLGGRAAYGIGASGASAW